MNPVSVVSLVSFAAQVFVLVFLLYSRTLIAPPLGLGIQAAGVLLMIWARMTFGTRSFHAEATPTEGRLVTSGPYAVVRHPIYAAILMFTVPPLVFYWDRWNAVALLVMIAATMGRITSEESRLRKKYPAYADYSNRTSRIIPGVY